MKGLFLGVALLAMTAGASQAATYAFTFTGSDYDVSGKFTTSNIANSDGAFNILTGSGTLSLDPGSTATLLPTGAFSLFGGNTVGTSFATTPDGQSEYNNTYDAVLNTFAGQGVEFMGSNFGLNIYNSLSSGFTACGNGVMATCASVPFSNDFNPGDIGKLSITAVPEPASWALMIGGLGLVGFALRRRNGLRSAAA